jgi:hypothetical protein
MILNEKIHLLGKYVNTRIKKGIKKVSRPSDNVLFYWTEPLGLDKMC